MGWLEAIVLGVVQGLTEFLPISSSGHLVVVPAVLRWDQPDLTFDLILHLGTLVAVLFSFRRDLLALLTGLFGGGPDPRADRRMIGLLALGSIPAGIAGLALGSEFESLFEEPLWACFFWVLTALILLGAERIIRAGVARHDVDARRATWIGVAQAAAITPGISRSGTTIAAGVAQGMTREAAARFSFLLAIPAIIGAAATRVADIASGEFEITGPVVAGFVAAAVSGWLAIDWFLAYLRAHSLRVFAIYLLIAAPVAALIIELR